MASLARVRLVALGSLIVSVASSEVTHAQLFVRGDVDGSGSFQVTDAVVLLNALFRGGFQRITCTDAADADDSGDLSLSDAVFILQSLFRRGDRPPYPFPGCGADLTEDPLECREFVFCGDIVPFFGEGFAAADGMYFIVDRSGSMQDSGELSLAKQEIIRVIGELPEGTQFGVIFSDRWIVRFPAAGEPAVADAATRAAAVAWVTSIPGGAASCPEIAFLNALDWAGQATGPRQAIHYVGDGGGTCPGHSEREYLRNMIENVTARNAGRAQIYTFGVLMQGRGEFYAEILTELAVRNGGVYTEVNR